MDRLLDPAIAKALDEHLAEVDRWKRAAQDKLDALSPEARAERLAQIRAEFEAARRRPLEKPKPAESAGAIHTT